jgi:insecticidal toxin complex protein TccC
MAQLTEALNGSWGQGDLDLLNARLDELTGYLDSQQASLQEHFDTLTDAAPTPVKLIGIAQMPERTDNDLAHLQQQVTVARATIKHARNLLGRVSAYLAQKQQAA